MLLTEVFSAKAVSIRQSSDPSNRAAFLGPQFFPLKRKMGIDLKFIETHNGLGVALKPSSLDSLAPIRPRGGFKLMAQQMPLFRESMMVSETDLVEIQRAQDANDPYLNETLGRIYDDVGALTDGAEISVERMRMALMAPINGEVKIKIGMADNTLYSYDYDSDGSWKSDHYMELTGTDTWDNQSSASPLNDIQEATDFLTGEGVIPTYLVMNSTTFNYLLKSEQMQKMNSVSQFGINTGFLDKSTVKAIIAANTGLTVLVYNKKYKDYDGSTHKYFPDNYVTIIGADTLGYTWYGVTPEERTLLGDAKVDVSVLESGVAIAVKTEYGPPVQYSTTASQIVLPSFEGMDSIYTIKVK